jgi:hypothetical protein
LEIIPYVKHQNYLYARILAPSIFGLLLAGLFGFLNHTAKNELQLLVEEQAANLYNGEIKFKPIFDQAAGDSLYDSFSGYFQSMNNILNYWNIQRKNCKDFSINIPTT